MSNKKRRDSFDFFNPRWTEAVPGLAAAVWTNRDDPWFGGPYERVADLLLWVVRSVKGRPIMACFRPRIDPKVAVATVDRGTLVRAWDLAAREGDHALRPKADRLACGVADMFVAQWPRAAVGGFPVPSAYVGYGGRIPVRRTPELAQRLPEGATDADVAAAWDRVPVRPRDGERNHRWLYPAKFVSGDAWAPDVHPETLEPRPHAGAASAPGWARRGDGWAPAAPAGRGIMYVDLSRVAGLEFENPAWQLYREFGLLDAKARRDDREAVEAAAARLADPEEFTKADLLRMAEDMFKRLPRRAKFTLQDRLDALLNPYRPLVASTYARVASFPESELAGIEGRGWEFDLAPAAAPKEAAAPVVEGAAAES